MYTITTTTKWQCFSHMIWGWTLHKNVQICNSSVFLMPFSPISIWAPELVDVQMDEQHWLPPGPRSEIRTTSSRAAWPWCVSWRWVVPGDRSKQKLGSYLDIFRHLYLCVTLPQDMRFRFVIAWTDVEENRVMNLRISFWKERGMGKSCQSSQMFELMFFYSWRNYNYFVWKNPTLTFQDRYLDINSDTLPAIVSDIYSNILSDILLWNLSGKYSGSLSNIYSGILSDIYHIFWQPIGHLFWHLIWNSIWQSFWQSTLQSNLIYILTFYLAIIVTVYMTDILAFYLTHVLAFHLTFFLANTLTFFMTYFLAFHLTFTIRLFLTDILIFWHSCLCGIYTDTLSSKYAGILSDIHSHNLSWHILAFLSIWQR